MAYPRTYLTDSHPLYIKYKSGMVATKDEREAGLVNTYSYEDIFVTGSEIYGAYYYSGYHDRGISDAGFYDPTVRNKLYGKWSESLRPDAATLAVTIAEWRSSYEMIAVRALQVVQRYKKWRRTVSGPPITVQKKRRRKKNNYWRDRNKPDPQKDMAKRIAAGWLEYWMGLAPLVGDISNAVKQLDLPGPTSRLRVSWSQMYEHDDGQSFNGPFPWYYSSMKYSRRSRYGCTAQVQVVNANLYLARNMGLTNPLEWAWELTPWSWLVNWFVNVDQVLSQHSVLHGLRVDNIAGTLKSEINGACRNTYWSWNGSAWIPLIDNQGFSGTAFFRRRFEGLPTPELVLDIPTRLSLTRAATAISLLVQQLKT